MTTSDASLQREVSSATGSVLGPKDKTHIGTWNARTMYETSKLAQVTSEMKRHRLSEDGQTLTTWRRNVVAEMMEMSYTWGGEAQHVAQDRDRWKNIIEALCSTGNEED